MVLSSPAENPLMMIKLDLEKAFDRGKYVEVVLRSLGFPDVWIKWTLLEGLLYPVRRMNLPSTADYPNGSRLDQGSGKAAPYYSLRTYSPYARKCSPD